MIAKNLTWAALIATALAAPLSGCGRHKHSDAGPQNADAVTPPDGGDKAKKDAAKVPAKTPDKAPAHTTPAAHPNNGQPAGNRPATPATPAKPASPNAPAAPGKTPADATQQGKGDQAASLKQWRDSVTKTFDEDIAAVEAVATERGGTDDLLTAVRALRPELEALRKVGDDKFAVQAGYLNEHLAAVEAAYGVSRPH